MKIRFISILTAAVLLLSLCSCANGNAINLISEDEDEEEDISYIYVAASKSPDEDSKEVSSETKTSKAQSKSSKGSSKSSSKSSGKSSASSRQSNKSSQSVSSAAPVTSVTQQGTDFPVTFINYEPQGKSIYYNPLVGKKYMADIGGNSYRESTIDPRIINSTEEFKKVCGYQASVRELTKKYDSDFFKENALIHLSLFTPNSGHAIKVTNLVKKDTTLNISIDDISGVLTAIEDRAMLIEMKKADIEQITDFTFYYRRGKPDSKGEVTWNYYPSK